MSEARQAVALAYAPGGTPRVVAKGEGAVGDRILDLAAEAGVPIERNPELAAALSAVELDAEIPIELFRAVAIVIGQVLRARP
jgi:flagellar biosynthesis protein